MEGNSYKDNDKLFLLADEYPVLYYSLDFQFNKKTNVQYIYANGAPHFEENTNEAGDLLLSLKVKNMPKYQSEFWASTTAPVSLHRNWEQLCQQDGELHGEWEQRCRSQFKKGLKPIN